MVSVAKRPLIVGIGGTTRDDSATERALRYALSVAADAGAETTAFYGPELARLPIYAADEPRRSEAAERFVAELRRADGILVASPAYHGSVSGLVKNALDYVEDLRDDDRAYFDGLAVGCIATGGGWHAIVATLIQLRTIAHALRGWPTPLGVTMNTSETEFGPNGEIVDAKVRWQLETVAQEVVQFAKVRAGHLLDTVLVEG